MESDKRQPLETTNSELRRRAETAFERANRDVENLPPDDARRLLHELDVHQIELQMQNEELVATQLALEESRSRLADLYDNAPAGYCTLEPDSTIREANHMFATMLGGDRRSLIGRRFTSVVDRDHQDPFYLFHQSLLETQDQRSCDLLLRRRDNSLLWARLDATREEQGGNCRCVITDISGRKQLEDSLKSLTARLEDRVTERTRELAAANARLKTELAERELLERQIDTIAESERQRIGLDLHDGLVQILTGLRFKAESLVSTLSASDPSIAGEVRSIALHLRQAVSYARLIARGLQPVEPVPDGLAEALGQLAETTSHLSQVQCRFLMHGDGLVADRLAAFHLYRIAQEAVTNAIKHAKPGSIRISLRTRAGKIALSVVNDGGRPHRLGSHHGLGIKSMNHRAARIGAGFECRPHRAAGMLVRCVIPGPCDRGSLSRF